MVRMLLLWDDDKDDVVEMKSGIDTVQLILEKMTCWAFTRKHLD